MTAAEDMRGVAVGAFCAALPERLMRGGPPAGDNITLLASSVL